MKKFKAHILIVDDDERIRELAYLNKGIKIVLIDERENEKRTQHYYKGGLSEFVKYLNRKNTPLFTEPVHIKGEKDGVPVALALSYNETYSSNILTFEIQTFPSVSRSIIGLISS